MEKANNEIKNEKRKDDTRLTVFLGGTCGTSTWRSQLIPMLDSEKVSYFNPQLGPGEWCKEAQEIEDFHRETDDIRVYVITPEGEGFYSFVEAIDDSNKRPDRTVVCILMEQGEKTFEKHIKKCAEKTKQLIAENGAIVLESLEEVANYLNTLKEKQIEREIEQVIALMTEVNATETKKTKIKIIK